MREVIIMATVAVPLCLMLASGAEGQQEPEVWVHPDCERLPIDRIGPIVELGDGRLMMVQGNASITSEDDGASWSQPQPIYQGEPPGVPSTGQLIRTSDGVLILVYMDASTKQWRWNDEKGGPDVAELDVWSIRSTDDGRTWTDRQKLLDGWCGAVMDIIETTDGEVVVPVQDLLLHPARHAQYTYTTSDNGQSWVRSNVIDIGGHGHHDGGCEGTLTELSDGRLYMLLRTNLDRFWEALSDDHRYWRELRPSPITASSSPGGLQRLASGRIALVYNRLYPEGTVNQDEYPRQAGQYSEVMASWHREELSIRFSEDDCRTWSDPVVIMRKQGAWVSYPRVFERRPGELWITCSQLKPITWVRLMEDDFVARERQ
ncbi:MAG: sialidase family protein [Armatimonadota bacterium]|nr:sialidase family protein [Armatimonadota bacterium]